MNQNELNDSMIVDDNNLKINEADLDLDFNDKEEYVDDVDISATYRNIKEKNLKNLEDKNKKKKWLL